jgi:hypothetical protein
VCTADTGVVTFRWVKHIGLSPDFNAQHQCGNFDTVMEWNEKNGVQVQNDDFNRSIPKQVVPLERESLRSIEAE